MRFSAQIRVMIKGYFCINWNEELRDLPVEEAAWDMESQMQELFGTCVWSIWIGWVEHVGKGSRLNQLNTKLNKTRVIWE